MKMLEKKADNCMKQLLLLRRVNVGKEECGGQHAVCLLQQSTALLST